MGITFWTTRYINIVITLFAFSNYDVTWQRRGPSWTTLRVYTHYYIRTFQDRGDAFKLSKVQMIHNG